MCVGVSVFAHIYVGKCQLSVCVCFMGDFVCSSLCHMPCTMSSQWCICHINLFIKDYFIGDLQHMYKPNSRQDNSKLIAVSPKL